MKMLTIYLLFFLFVCPSVVGVCITPQGNQAKQSGNLNRLFVIDTSGSMNAPGRLDAVKKEVSNTLNQFPPSPLTPVSIVCFGSTPLPPQEFTSLKKANEYINGLVADGGTNIPAALFDVAERIRNHPNSNVMVFMFSDGENMENDHLMPQALTEINSLFLQRANRQLSNVLVLHQWGAPNGLNSQLQSLANTGAVRFLQTRGLNFNTIKIDPVVQILKTKRLKNNQVEVEGLLELKMAGSTAVPIQVPVKLSASHGRKLTGFTMNTSSPRIRFRRLITITNEENHKDQFELSFELGTPKESFTQSQIVLPQLTKSRLKVLVVLAGEDLLRKTLVTSDLSGKAPEWKDPELLTAIYQVDLTFDTRSKKADKFGPSTYEIHCQSPERIVSGPRKISLAPNSKKTITLEIVCKSRSTTEADFRINLKTIITGLPANVRPETPELSIEIDNLTPPSKLVTRIQPHVTQLRRAQWSHPGKGRSQHAVKVSMEADGVVVPSGPFSLVDSADQDAKVQSPSIVDARTVVTAYVTMRTAPEPASKTVELSFNPPTETPSVRYEMLGPATYSVTGPPPIPLAAHLGKTNFNLWFDNKSLTLPVTVRSPRCAADASQRISVTVEAKQPGFHSGIAKTWVGYSVPLPITCEVQTGESFFLDTREKGIVRVSTDASLPYVSGESMFTVTKPAKFKKIILFYVGPGIFVVLIGAMIWFGLRDTDDEDDYVAGNAK